MHFVRHQKLHVYSRVKPGWRYSADKGQAESQLHYPVESLSEYQVAATKASFSSTEFLGEIDTGRMY